MKLPEKFKERMKDMLAEEYDDFITSMEKNPIFTGIRINTLKKNAREAVLKEFGDLEKIPWCKDGFYIDKSKVSGNHPYHIAGLFYFQEPSAMATVSALPIENGDYVLDLCAAPGGKATQAGAALSNTGFLMANEIIRGRANILLDNIERFGLTNTIVTNETPQKLAEKYENFFDKIIVDAPCSGEGMFRKKPQAVDEWSMEHTISCGARQKNILDCAAKMLKSGGYLVYSTCTFSPEENEKICAYMLKNYDFDLIKANNADMLSPGQNEWVNSEHDVSASRRIFPHKQKGEGHFLALFKSRGVSEKLPEMRKKKSARENDAEKAYRKFENDYLNTRLEGEFLFFGENIYLSSADIDIEKIKTIRAGLHLGIYRKNRFEPSHALCLALEKNDFKNFMDFACESEELKKYLMGNTISCDKKGWCAVGVNGFPIGWGKASDGVLKNHFPKYMRLKR